MALTLADYAPPVNALVLALKSRARLDLAYPLGTMLARVATRAWDDVCQPVIVPMPLAPTRLRERGYNQARELARQISRQTQWPLLPDLAVSRDERPVQHYLHRRRRLQNLQGAFRVHVPLNGASAILIDDVMTTGASLFELAQCLLLAGAGSVRSLVIARTP
jgi:ComF family protein